jgi:multimeric flavodoxin WrbA
MQYVEYLKRIRPDVGFDVVQPAFRIRKLEQRPEIFDRMMDVVRRSDAVLWAFPLYIHSVCSQFHRFIELIFERNAADTFAGKPAAALSTSIHFFDNTAHDFIRSVSEDLNMSFVESHSAYMNDLIKAPGQRALEGFFRIFENAIESGALFQRLFPVLDAIPAPKPIRSQEPVRAKPQSPGTRVAVVTDTSEGVLGSMINEFCASFTEKPEIIDLRKIRISGGCTGCLQCGPDNVCRYGDSDDVMKTYSEKIAPADVYVMAATIRGRWYSSLMKSFVDRGFFHTHQPYLTGKQVAVILDGDIQSNPALRDGITGFFEWQGGSLNGIAASANTGESGTGAAVNSLARRVISSLQTGYMKPATFLGVGGMKVFRDDIYTHLRMVFKADHRYYRKNGIYKTLPHKRPLSLLRHSLIGLVAGIPPVNRKMISNMKNFMLMPYRHVLNEAGDKSR